MIIRKKVPLASIPAARKSLSGGIETLNQEVGSPEMGNCMRRMVADVKATIDDRASKVFARLAQLSFVLRVYHGTSR